MKYLKIWTSFLELISTLEYDEIGRLFEMMLIYAESGKEPEDIDGNERFLWPVAKQQIDLSAEKNEILRQNGMKGGRPKTKDNQTEPKITKDNQTKAIKERKEKERNEKENKLSSSFLDDDNAQGIVFDHDRVLNAAEDAGFKMSNDVRAALIALYADHGLQKILDGLKSCVDHGAPNLAYLKAVLKGEPRKASGKTVSAQQYSQRDYADEQEAAFNRMIREIQQSQTG